jgi:selenocysteine lyase/cysteine desulfurase
MDSLGMFFNPTASLANKLALAGENYELVQAIPQVLEYFGGWDPEGFNEIIAEHEQKLSKILLDFLNSRDDVTIYGATTDDPKIRVPTISFTIRGWNPKDFVELVEGQSDYAFRWGHNYSKRLIDEILLCCEEGVIRISMVSD